MMIVAMIVVRMTVMRTACRGARRDVCRGALFPKETFFFVVVITLKNFPAFSLKTFQCLPLAASLDRILDVFFVILQWF